MSRCLGACIAVKWGFVCFCAGGSWDRGWEKSKRGYDKGIINTAHFPAKSVNDSIWCYIVLFNVFEGNLCVHV